MWSPGELNEHFNFTLSPPQAGEYLLPVNVDNNNNLTAAVGQATSSSSSELPVKRPHHNLEMEPVDNVDHSLDATELDPRPQVPAHGPDGRPVPNQATLPAAASPESPLQEGLPETNTGKRKRSKKEIDSDYRARQKVKKQELESNSEKLKMDNGKLEVLMEESKAQNARSLAELESSKMHLAQMEINLAQMEINLAQIKTHEETRKKAMAYLHKLIEEDVSCNIGKEDLWTQFCSQNGMQIFEKYWEENKKHKHHIAAIVKMLLDLP